MKAEYAQWIADNVHEYYGKCAEVTLRMQQAFPELIRERGHYYDVAWGERAHWWLVTADDEIVDPTASQFPTKGRGHYEPIDPDAPEPIGKCIGCGGYCYEGAPSNVTCSKECEDAVVADMSWGKL